MSISSTPTKAQGIAFLVIGVLCIIVGATFAVPGARHPHPHR